MSRTYLDLAIHQLAVLDCAIGPTSLLPVVTVHRPLKTILTSTKELPVNTRVNTCRQLLAPYGVIVTLVNSYTVCLGAARQERLPGWLTGASWPRSVPRRHLEGELIASTWAATPALGRAVGSASSRMLDMRSVDARQACLPSSAIILFSKISDPLIQRARSSFTMPDADASTCVAQRLSLSRPGEPFAAWEADLIRRLHHEQDHKSQSVLLNDVAWLFKIHTATTRSMGDLCRDITSLLFSNSDGTQQEANLASSSQELPVAPYARMSFRTGPKMVRFKLHTYGEFQHPPLQQRRAAKGGKRVSSVVLRGRGTISRAPEGAQEIADLVEDIYPGRTLARDDKRVADLYWPGATTEEVISVLAQFRACVRPSAVCVGVHEGEYEHEQG